MVLCLIAGLLCSIAVPVLSTLRIRHIEIEGATYYSEQQLLSLTGLNVGDELLIHSPKAIKELLLEQCTYLTDAQIKRGLGGYTLMLRESTPRWALLLEDGRAALLDEQLYVPEIVPKSSIPAGLCTLALTLPPVESKAEDGKTTVLVEQQLTAGKNIIGSSAALAQLEKISQALDKVTLHEAPILLDLSNLYEVTLTLRDGTVLLLHGCDQPESLLRSVATALHSYLEARPTVLGTGTLHVDAADTRHISIRVMPSIEPEQSEKNDELDKFSEKK